MCTPGLIVQDVNSQLAELRGQLADFKAQNTRLEALLQRLADRQLHLLQGMPAGNAIWVPGGIVPGSAPAPDELGGTATCGLTRIAGGGAAAAMQASNRERDVQ